MDTMMTRQSRVATVEEIEDDLHRFEEVHVPYDRVSKLPLHMFFIGNSPSGSLVPFSDVTKPLALTDRAMGQMLARLDYPRRLYGKLPQKLNTTNINWLIQHGAYEKDVLLRIQDSDLIRAVMSSKYEPFDNVELWDILKEYIDGGTVRWYHHDDETMHISITWPTTQTEVRKGDIVEQGIHISNSEVGLRSVTVAAYVRRLICENGLIGSSNGGGMYRFRHTGNSDKARQLVGEAIKQTKFEATKIIATFKDALNRQIDNPFNMIEDIAKEKDITQEQFKHALDCFMLEPEDNMAGVSNAFSRAAQAYEGETSYQLQRVATYALTAGGKQ